MACIGDVGLRRCDRVDRRPQAHVTDAGHADSPLLRSGRIGDTRCAPQAAARQCDVEGTGERRTPLPDDAADARGAELVPGRTEDPDADSGAGVEASGCDSDEPGDLKLGAVVGGRRRYRPLPPPTAPLPPPTDSAPSKSHSSASWQALSKTPGRADRSETALPAHCLDSRPLPTWCP